MCACERLPALEAPAHVHRSHLPGYRPRGARGGDPEWPGSPIWRVWAARRGVPPRPERVAPGTWSSTRGENEASPEASVGTVYDGWLRAQGVFCGVQHRQPV